MFLSLNRLFSDIFQLKSVYLWCLWIWNGYFLTSSDLNRLFSDIFVLESVQLWPFGFKSVIFWRLRIWIGYFMTFFGLLSFSDVFNFEWSQKKYAYIRPELFHPHQAQFSFVSHYSLLLLLSYFMFVMESILPWCSFSLSRLPLQCNNNKKYATHIIS